MSEQTVMENYPTHVHFTVEGGFITNFAREKLFVEKNLAGAVKLLRSALVTDQLDSDEQLMLCLQVLNGDACIKGNSDSDDYGVEFRDGIDERPTNLESIGQMIVDMAEELKQLREENNCLMHKVTFLAHEVGTWKLERVNADYYNETGEPLFSEIPISDWRKTENQYDGAVMSPASSMLDSFLEQRKREIEAMEKGEEVDCDYGWLEPDGTFHPVPWGLHSEWARKWLEDHYPFKENEELYWHVDKNGVKHIIMNGDVLIYSLGWVLLDNPYQGLPRITRDDSREMSKAQKEFLFDFFVDRNRTEEANALCAED